MTSGPTSRFHWLGRLEGASFLLLLCVAMPLKYWAGFPLAVRVVGIAHGALFLFYVAAIVNEYQEDRFAGRVAGEAFIAAFLPFGPFVFERREKSRAASAR